MTTEKQIPDAETRAPHADLFKIAEADLQNSPFYVRRRERVRKQLESYKG